MIYTDGILEARNQTGEQYGHDRLNQFMADQHELATEDFADLLEKTILNWAGGAAYVDDDIALIVIDIDI